MWGPLNKSLYIATNKGRMFLYDLETEKYVVQEDVHKDDIISFNLTYDHTMLITCSRDGTAKLLNPRTFEVVRTF